MRASGFFVFTNKTIMLKPKKIIEAGHYYQDIGPTIAAKIGWRIAEQMRDTHDKLMLFVDDVHTADQAPEIERALPLATDFKPAADYIIYESTLVAKALGILESLKTGSKKQRARRSSKTGIWRYKGTPLTHPDGTPNCTLLDVALCFHKAELGFERGLNILPAGYAGQQKNVLSVISRILPDFQLEQHLIPAEDLLSVSKLTVA